MADINALIAQGGTPVQVENPINAMAKVYALQNAQLQNQLARQQFEQEQGVADYLRAADLTTPAGRAGLRQFGKTGLGYEKLISEQETNALKRKELEGKVRDQQMAALGAGLTLVLPDPSDEKLTAAFDRLDATGVNTKPFRDQFAQMPDLEQRKAALTQYLTSNPEGRKALEFVQPKLEKIDLNGKIVFKDMNPNSPTYLKQGEELATTMTPYQEKQLKLEQDKFAWEKAHPGYTIKDTDTGFVAINNKDPNDVKPVKLGAGGPPVQSSKGLTESQAKATGFAARAKEADNIIAVNKGNPTAVATKQGMETAYGVGGVLGAAANVSMSPESQKLDQAQRNFVNAVLRQESGAAISESEFQNARKQYFPQPGDSKEVVEQKARNRKTAIQSLETIAGPGMRKMEKEAAASDGTPNIREQADAILSGGK